MGNAGVDALVDIAHSFIAFAPDWMTLASLRVTMHGSELSKAELIVPEKSPPAPAVTADLESTLRAYIRNNWERVRGYGEEWYLYFVLDRGARECRVKGPSDASPYLDFFDNWGPPKRAPRGAYKYKPPPRARKAKTQPPPEAGS